MKRKQKTLIIALFSFLVIIAVFVAVSLGNGNEGDVLDEEESQSEIDVQEEVEPEPEPVVYYSPYTGEEVSETVAATRPVAVMINNIEQALPQAGISQADIFYEIPVEGSITRCMAIFQDYSNLDLLGSIRSSRLYFAYISQSYDAIYVHYGQSKYALSYLKSSSIDNITPIKHNLESVAFYRSSAKRAPHNVYTNSQMLTAGIAQAGYQSQLEANYQSPFRFNLEAQVNLGSTKANEIYPGYKYSDTTFKYNATTGLYERYEFNHAHIDESNGQQLAFKNVIIQYVASHYEADNYTLNINTTGSGSGYYFTNGEYIPVTWKCDGVKSPTKFYREDGSQLEMNVGKTSICVVPNSDSDLTEIIGENED